MTTVDDIKIYTGVGSRHIPEHVARQLWQYADTLEQAGWTVRTGDASGCDAIFRNCHLKQVFDPLTIKDQWPDHWAYHEAQRWIPSDRGGYNFWKPYVRALIARNMQQVLGERGEVASTFLLCYAPSVQYGDSSSGGTGYAVRCALGHGVAVYNLYSSTDTERFESEVLKELV